MFKDLFALKFSLKSFQELRKEEEKERLLKLCGGPKNLLTHINRWTHAIP